MDVRRIVLAVACAACCWATGCVGEIAFSRDSSVATPGDPYSPDSTEPESPPEPSGGGPVIEPPDGPPLPEPGQNPNALAPSELFTCSPEAAAATPARVRMLTRDEWMKRISTGASKTRDGGNDAPLSPAPTNRYSTFTDGDFFNDSTMTQMFASASRLAKLWSNNLSRDAKKCMEGSDSAPFTGNCSTKTLIDMVAPRLRRTPLTDEERADLEATFDEEFQRSGSKRAAMLMLFERMILSPRSLYRFELGEDVGDEAGRRRLAPLELAEALSYALSQGGFHHSGHSVATRAIYEAARNGNLETPAQLEAHVRALIWDIEKDRDSGQVTRRVGEKTKRFFREYLGYTKASEVFKDRPYETSRYTGSQLAANFVNEAVRAEQVLEGQISSVLRADEDVLRALLAVSEVNFTPQENGKVRGLDKIFNVVDPETGQVPSGRVDLSSERKGVLNQPAWLMAHGHNQENDGSIIHRGKWVYENMLCGVIPDIPIDVEAVLPEEDWSARRRVAEATEPLATDSEERQQEKEYCWQCHKFMNPLGEAFEIYNHAGAVRVEDHGAPPDGSATLVSTGDPMLDGLEIRDAVELADLLASSPVVEQCFVRQTFRFYMGRPETVADACTLDSMLGAYQSSGGSFEEMLVALFSSDSFLYRVDVDVEADTRTEEEKEEGY